MNDAHMNCGYSFVHSRSMQDIITKRLNIAIRDTDGSVPISRITLLHTGGDTYIFVIAVAACRLCSTSHTSVAPVIAGASCSTLTSTPTSTPTPDTRCCWIMTQPYQTVVCVHSEASEPVQRLSLQAIMPDATTATAWVMWMQQAIRSWKQENQPEQKESLQSSSWIGERDARRLACTLDNVYPSEAYVLLEVDEQHVLYMACTGTQHQHQHHQTDDVACCTQEGEHLTLRGDFVHVHRNGRLYRYDVMPPGTERNIAYHAHALAHHNRTVSVERMIWQNQRQHLQRRQALSIVDEGYEWDGWGGRATFTVFSDGRVRGRFEDRTIVEVNDDGEATQIIDSGGQLVAPEHVTHYQVYIQTAIRYKMEVMRTPEEKMQQIQQQLERQRNVKNYLERVDRMLAQYDARNRGAEAKKEGGNEPQQEMHKKLAT